MAEWHKEHPEYPELGIFAGYGEFDMENTTKSALWHRCHAFVEEQSCGEWGDKDVNEDTEKLYSFVLAELAAYMNERAL
jgi:hypothetical protein